MKKTLRDLGTAIVVTATPETLVTRAAQLMREHHVGALVVVNSRGEDGRPLGIVTDRDLVLAILAEELDPSLFTVGDIMTTDLVCAASTASLGDAIVLMRKHRLRRLVVQDDAQRVVGVATLEDVLEGTAEELGELALALRAARDRERIERR